MTETNDSNARQSWRDQFIQKIFRGVSTFSLIPVIAHIIAPMITVFLPVAYSIYYLLRIPSIDVMYGVIKFGEETIFGMLIYSLLAGFYFIGAGVLVFSIITMAKERKKGKSNLIQHGIYAKIRHPQNMGISLIVFSAFVLVDTYAFRGLHTGHMISWGVFTLFLQLESLIEEKQLLKQFPDQYWAYIHRTGFFLPRLRKEKPIPPYLPESESKYSRIRIILSVCVFIIYYLIVFSTVTILKDNYSDMIYFRDPFHEGSNFYPDFMIVNEIIVVLVPIGIWLGSFIITLVHYLKEKRNKDSRKSNEVGKEKKVFLPKWRIFLFLIFVIFLLIMGIIMIIFVDGYRYWLVRV